MLFVSHAQSDCNVTFCCDLLSSLKEGPLSKVKRLLEDPEDLCCPISRCLMENPVVASDGYTYDTLS